MVALLACRNSRWLNVSIVKPSKGFYFRRARFSKQLKSQYKGSLVYNGSNTRRTIKNTTTSSVSKRRHAQLVSDLLVLV